MKMKCLAGAIILVAACAATTADAGNLVILHTNDTHSQIDPADNGMGGVVRRKAAIDSVRALNPDVLLIDAGDAVQGTMYFTIYKGEVEYSMLDLLGYDAAIVGNHDFDNGMNQLAKELRNSKTNWITSNYDLTGAPALDSIFKPYIIKEYEGKKIGILGINLVPEGMIAKGNYDGVVYLDAYETANKTAAKLRELGADYVIAVTHIGYDGAVDPSDVRLAAASHGIDLIIGGHSHSFIDPKAPSTDRYYWRHANADGDTIGVVQAGSRGAYLGQVNLNLDNGHMDYSIIPVDSTFDSRADSSLVAVIDRYRSAVDSIMHIEVGRTARKLGKDDAGLVNFLGDFVAFRGQILAGTDIDMSIINAGGIRRELPEGQISKGMLIDMLPFNNRIVVLEISGADLLEAIDNVVRRGGFDGINEGVQITFDPDKRLKLSAMLNGQTIDPQATYTLATIDYLANGGDYMTSLPRAHEIARSHRVLYDDLIEYVETVWDGRPIDGDPERRIVPVKQ